MRATVTGRCQGHTQCAFTAPELFDLDPMGRGRVLHDPVPPHLQAAALEAADSCPELAIRITNGEDNGTT